MSIYTYNNDQVVLETQFEITQCHLDWICMGHNILGIGTTEMEAVDDWFEQRYNYE